MFTVSVPWKTPFLMVLLILGFQFSRCLNCWYLLFTQPKNNAALLIEIAKPKLVGILVLITEMLVSIISI